MEGDGPVQYSAVQYSGWSGLVGPRICPLLLLLVVPNPVTSAGECLGETWSACFLGLDVLRVLERLLSSVLVASIPWELWWDLREPTCQFRVLEEEGRMKVTGSPRKEVRERGVLVCVRVGGLVGGRQIG